MLPDCSPSLSLMPQVIVPSALYLHRFVYHMVSNANNTPASNYENSRVEVVSFVQFSNRDFTKSMNGKIIR